MKSLLRLPRLLLAGASLLVVAQSARAQLNDGKPDPSFAVPERLDLEYALAFALDNSFAIRQAKESIRRQEGVVLEVRAEQIPHVVADAGHVRLISDPSTDYHWSFGITARQVLFSGGGVSASVKSERLALAAATLALQSVINNVLLDVRVRFYTVLVNREKIKVQEQNVELLRRQLQDVKNRFEAGTVSNFEVLRAEVALANAQPALITARNDHRLAIEELRQTLGFTTTAEDSLTKVPEFLGTLVFTPTHFELRSSLAEARLQRPDLQRLQKLEAAAAEGVTIGRAGYYPNLALAGGYDWSRSGLTAGRSTKDSWSIGLQSQWNIFDGRATAGRVAQARSFHEQTKLALAEATLAVDVDVRRAISIFQQSTELAAASIKVVEQAEESVRLANARFAAGTATQLDVLQSQNDLTTARLNQLEAYYSYNVAVASVRRALGLADEKMPTRELKYPTQ